MNAIHTTAQERQRALSVMAVYAGRDFKIKEVDGQLCLVNAAGHKVFTLAQADARIDMDVEDAAKLTATFFILVD